MTISQALKEKNKKISTLQKLWDRLHRYNVVVEGETRPYSTTNTWNDIVTLTGEIAQLKTDIHRASEPVRLHIFMMSELKNKAQRLKSLNTSNGVQHDRYSNTTTVQVADLDVLWKDMTMDSIEKQIEDTQELLDKFNHTTHI